MVRHTRRPTLFQLEANGHISALSPHLPCTIQNRVGLGTGLCKTWKDELCCMRHINQGALFIQQSPMGAQGLMPYLSPAPGLCPILTMCAFHSTEGRESESLWIRVGDEESSVETTWEPTWGIPQIASHRGGDEKAAAGVRGRGSVVQKAAVKEMDSWPFLSQALLSFRADSLT